MKEIIIKGLKRFIDHQILQFDDCKKVPIHFVGSIAFYLKDEIKETLDTYGLSIGNIIQRPIAVDGNVEIRPVMYLALSYDHRIIDGKEAVSFLKIVKESLEQPKRLFLNI